MNLIFNLESKQMLETRYTVLELETIAVPGTEQPITAWCVVEAEKVIPEIDMLPLNKSLHEDLLAAIKQDNVTAATKLCAELTGKFGGELDTFYEEIAKRIERTGSCAFVPAVE